jgi:hypothetical protein
VLIGVLLALEPLGERTSFLRVFSLVEMILGNFDEKEVNECGDRPCRNRSPHVIAVEICVELKMATVLLINALTRLIVEHVVNRRIGHVYSLIEESLFGFPTNLVPGLRLFNLLPVDFEKWEASINRYVHGRIGVLLI